MKKWKSLTALALILMLMMTVIAPPALADALYGVSMQGDGVTTVVSQRVKDVTPAGARGPGEPVPAATAAAPV